MKYIRNNYDDILILAGCGLVLVGIHQVNPVLTWFGGGLMLIALGALTWAGKRGKR